MESFGPVATGWLLKESLRVFARRFWVFIAINALIGAPVLVVSNVLYWYESERTAQLEAAALEVGFFVDVFGSWYSLTLLLAMMLITIPLGYVATAFAVTDYYSGTTPKVLSPIGRALSLLIPLVSSATWYSIAVIAGLVLLIIPGLYLSIRFYLTYQIVAMERIGGKQALTRSGELGNDHFTTVLIIFVITLTPIFVIVGMSELFSSVIAYVIFDTVAETVLYSFSGVASAVLYLACRAREEEVAPQEQLAQ